MILFDSNATTNPKVQSGRRALATWLAGRDAHVRIAELPLENGINGPDDYVGQHGDDALFALIDGHIEYRTKAKGRVYVSVVPMQAAAE